MPDYQKLTLEQLQTEGGVLTLNNMLQELYEHGHTVIIPYGASASASASEYLTSEGVQFTASIGYRMPRNGSIVGNSALLNITTATSGDVTLEVRINDTNQSSLELEFSSSLGTGVTSKSLDAARHDVAFSKGDIITFKATETGTMVWDSVLGFIEVILDNE